ncbi:probable pH-response regulator palA protein [Cephalotrichum gorgonifer]|uniref:Probable pH-response regulator palA protein n=1 Tax=Cephalotrichum gorgonifer TaxID=2041049 RepID=A0AAE8MZP0_9PEZI|nr:probable pH-response regulator palA protein [Cephalotrichum gorgonifer]
MATSTMIAIPFRKGSQLSLSSAIKQYINAKYDQHPEMFRQDLEVVDALRRDAVNVREAHPSGIKKLQAYAAQLVWMGGKFPIDIGADFTWYPATGYNVDRPITHNNLKFELLNVLYNLAALYSQLAISSATGTDEGFKSAANYFSLAAGVLTHMSTEVLPDLRMSDPPDDMDAHTLASLAQLSLAQAQESAWQKIVTGGKNSDAVIAKIAAKVSDYYDQACVEAKKTDGISLSWIYHMSAKHHHFASAAQYRAARDCLEKKKYGEEVARLKDAVSCVVTGLGVAKNGYIYKSAVKEMEALRRKVEEDLKRAEKDNDTIYYHAVPPKTDLALLDRADLTKPRIPPQVSHPFDHLGDKAEFGAALFTRLVPFSVHQATSIYEERRDRLLNQTIINSLESLTEGVHTTLATLGLPGSLQALEKPLGLPHSLTQHADELRQADALSRITKSFADIDKIRAADKAIYDEGLEILASEEEEDNRLRTKYGTDRWTRPTSAEDPQGAQLREQAREIEGYFATSLSSDGVVREKFASVRDTLALLAGPERKLMSAVPSSMQATIPENLKAVIGRLRGAYNDVLRLESRRRKKVDALREKARADDVRPDIQKEAARLERTYPSTTLVPAHFEDFLEKRLDRLYEAEVEGIKKEEVEQERLLAEVTRVNREFESQKRVKDGSTQPREEMLQRLEEGYFRYKDIVSNLEVGRKFYNDLSKIVGQIFRDSARTWANHRRMEARSLEEELSLPPLSTLNISRSPMHSPPAATYNAGASEGYFSPQVASGQTPPAMATQAQAQAQAQAQSQAQAQPEPQPPYRSWADSTVSPQQPRPVAPLQGMWTPDAGIKFASAAPARSGSPTKAKGTWNPGAGIKFG